MIQEALWDIRAFVLILAYFIIGIGVLFRAVIPSNSETTISDMLIVAFNANLGEFENTNFGYNEWLVFVIAILVNAIVMFNLLISIIGNSFDKIQNNYTVIEKKELLEIIIEGELGILTVRTLLILPFYVVLQVARYALCLRWLCNDPLGTLIKKIKRYLRYGYMNHKGYAYIQVYEKDENYSASNWTGKVRTITDQIERIADRIISTNQQLIKRIKQKRVKDNLWEDTPMPTNAR